MAAAGTRVWVAVDDDDAWVLASVNETFGGSVHMTRLQPANPPPGVDAQFSVSEEEFAKLTLVTGDIDTPVDDLVSLSDINSGMLLHTLRLRYAKDAIFTAIGPILVAVNPYRVLDICSPESIAAMMAEDDDKLPPHVFKLARSAFKAMMKTGGAQSILISGESGAGKTETTKLVMTCLAEVSGSSGSSTEAALESGILLEAFGNAKTVHNNNSSRFGKWCEVHFDPQGHISTCKVQSFLLEKSRVVSQGEGERNYHIFYQMLAGQAAEDPAPFIKDLKLLTGPREYNYTQGMTTADGIGDSQDWHMTLEKLEALGFSRDQCQQIFSLMAAVLGLGNISFETDSAGSGEQCKAANMAFVSEVASQLLHVEPSALQAALVTRKITSGRSSSYSVPLTLTQCVDTRDALAKAIYTAVFDYIISRLNEYMKALSPATIDLEEDEQFIGILDVFGFENFEFNSFEQLCINYTNEKLQQHFIDSVVKLQQEDYSREGITCAHISFPDNSEQIALIEGRQGVMGMLDEECALPKGSEEAYVEKMGKMFSQSDIYSKPVRGGMKRRSVMPSNMQATSKDIDKLQFNVRHYAGQVMYTAESWMDKNRGYLQTDLYNLMSFSDHTLLQALFPVSEKKDDKKASTVFASFKASLRLLSATLLQTSAHYIRCIKPNHEKVPAKFDGQFISRQLRYTGVASVVEIQRCGYPISLPKADFITRYRCCGFSNAASLDKTLSADEICTNLLHSGQALLGYEKSDWLSSHVVQLGKSKVFLREEVVKQLEKAREAIWDEGALHVQRASHRRVARRALALARAHKAGVSAVRAAVAARATADASSALAAVKGEWDKAGMRLTEPLQSLQRQLGELEMEVVELQRQAEGEQKALEALKAAIASKEFVSLKVELTAAKSVSQGISSELTAAIAQAELAVEAEEERKKQAEAAAAAAAAAAADAADAAAKAEAQKAEAEARKKIEEYKKWEAEAEKKAAAREQERRAALNRNETSLDLGGAPEEGTERLELEVKNDPRKDRGLGVEFNDMNTIVALTKGGMAVKEDKLKLGDIVIGVDGVPVKGKKVTSAMSETAASFKLTIVRYKSETAAALQAGAEHAQVVDMEGFLYKVKAKDGRAIRIPKKRWVVLQGSTLSWTANNQKEETTKANDADAGSQSLVGAVCTLPLRSTNNQMTPAMRAFHELRKFPFMLSWPNGEVPNEFVFAGSTSAERAAWATALKDAINRAKVGAPTAGWLYKDAGVFSLSGWKKRWFVISPDSTNSPAQLKFFESPQAKKAKGTLQLRGADVFVPKKLKGSSGYSHCFCITSVGGEEGGSSDVTTCTLLAASSSDELNKWIVSLETAIKSAAKGSTVPGRSPAAQDAKTPTSKAKAKVGGDVGASSVQAGASSNLEQMKLLDIDTLMTLRVKQLKAVLESMDVSAQAAVEKRDLVALIVKNR
mmetsp:Transcript_29462/g.48834  ORF Transcript_29462/g.48834 Transcript_29462/m.48834 type:complete len:1439 (-) Transcript_29462:104-4420(-)|eukprot:CAMPEP_0119303858 /NCGR_PEP_ID=MMETSP1333-20130426/5223_1 /TAXON_ID=418940 /ORGANISM="Scyphosphaera apsteinii, Strain RCC1455" /LENGTH=1438 /DNA_ID=CAMNT_0007306629 /DNA_START=30 /DNA_END=4346 /DNA_ORIENTATION=+